MASDRDTPLTIEIVEGELRIRIGIDTLMVAVRGGDDWDDDTMTVVDADVFAAEIAHALENNEQGDGTTDVHRAIDRAAMHAVENGSEAVRLSDEEIVYDRDGPR